MAKDDALFSRSGRSSLLGKRTVAKHTKVDEETSDILQRLAQEARMSESEFIAELLTIRAHGEDFMQKIALQRLAVVSGKGRE